MSRARVKASGLSSIATILMFVLGVFTLVFVSFLIGVAILILATAMYLFNWWFRGRSEGPLR